MLAMTTPSLVRRSGPPRSVARRRFLGYVVVFNLDPEPLVFVGATNASDWPARIESGSTYYFVAVDICQREKPISQQDKGKPVGVNKVQLSELWDSVKSS